MRGIVNRSTIEQEQILIWAATTHVQAAHALGPRLDSGQKLQSLEDIDFAHGDRRIFGVTTLAQYSRRPS